MVFYSWLYGERSVDFHKLLLLAGFIAALMGGALLTLASMRGEWREATAQVLSVTKVCEMQAQGSYGRRQRPAAVVIPCAHAQQFLSDNDGSSWRLREFFRGRVQLTGEGPTVVVETGLNGYFGSRPKVGDRARVLQDPGAPGRITTLSGPMDMSIPGYLLMGLGGFSAFVAFMWF